MRKVTLGTGGGTDKGAWGRFLSRDREMGGEAGAPAPGGMRVGITGAVAP